MQTRSATRHTLLGVLLGLGAAALGIALYCVIWALRFWVGDIESTFSPSTIRTEILRWGFVMYGIYGIPIGAVLGAIGGICVFLVRRRRSADPQRHST